ncbi:hypothetical protein MHU86_10528 [Fragilaria crotonensis]|nr:hypothetical protein MHU86_10528 [Fragilaria crotonensis]
MDKNLLCFAKQYISKNLSGGNPVSNSEILAFIRVELMLLFYRVLPSLYLDLDERSNFPSAGQGMDYYAQYREILHGLSVSGTSSQVSTTAWTPPMQHDREMAATMEVVRRTGAEIAFVSGVTQVGLDDDLLRMRSKMVVNHGFSQINIPCKGLGVIHHGAVSVTAGLYIDDIPEPTIHAELALFETNNIIQLTASQRTTEWFNQRCFRITGTGALAVWWRHFAGCSRLGSSGGEQLPTSVKATSNILGLKYLAEPADGDCIDDRDWVYTRHALSAFPIAQFKIICRLKLLLAVSGNKSCLIERILSSTGLIRPDAEHPVLEILLEKWFMLPLGSSMAMREGTLNEANVLP